MMFRAQLCWVERQDREIVNVSSSLEDTLVLRTMYITIEIGFK